MDDDVLAINASGRTTDSTIATTWRLSQGSSGALSMTTSTSARSARSPVTRRRHGVRAQRFVVCHNPEAAQRDAAVRERLVAHLRELIDGSDGWSARRRDEFVGSLKAKPADILVSRPTACSSGPDVAGDRTCGRTPNGPPAARAVSRCHTDATTKIHSPGYAA